MSHTENKIMIPDEVIVSKIYLIRGQKVMLDFDIADLYEVETKVLKQAVRRNIDIFPKHFMFELNEEEFKNLRSQFVTSSWGGQRYKPFVFTEHGILQLANVLRSKRARKMGIRIIEVFIKMSEILSNNNELLKEIDKIRSKLIDHDDKLLLIFEYIKQFEEDKQQRLEHINRKRIGFKTKEK